jgi:hypothetical protein
VAALFLGEVPLRLHILNAHLTNRRHHHFDFRHGRKSFRLKTLPRKLRRVFLCGPAEIPNSLLGNFKINLEPIHAD